MKLRETKYFFGGFIIFITTAIILMQIYTKAEIQIAVNKHHTPFFDFFFKYITHIGTGFFLGGLFLVTIFKNKKFAIQTALASLLMTLVIFVIKTKINAERPITFFKYTYQTNYNFHLVKGVDVHNYNSFPSGHTATAFTFFLLLSILFSDKNKILQIVFFTLALLVGYSRIYLMQHFLLDVTVASIISVVIVYLSVFIINKIYKND